MFCKKSRFDGISLTNGPVLYYNIVLKYRGGRKAAGKVAIMDKIIEVCGLEKTFKTKKTSVTALKDINLSIGRGDIFGIIGMSGAGKSTLVRCMNLLERPTEGKILFDGVDITTLRAKELQAVRQRVGMIFQQFNLLMQRTAEGNIMFPLEIAGASKEDAKRRVAELLDIVDLAGKKDAYPAELSGGQKQRVAIARALASDPKVLLCDEATSALDPKTTKSILRLLKQINRDMGITIVVITHEMSVIEEICTRVAIIDDSRIAEVGDVAQVFSDPKTDSAKRLVYPENRERGLFHGDHCMRIVFDGRSSFEPVLANMILECRAAVNILFADTKDIDGKAMGQMIIQLPEEELSRERIKAYLKKNNIRAEEVNANV